MGRVKHTSDCEGGAGTGMSFTGGGEAGELLLSHRWRRRSGHIGHWLHWGIDITDL